jgi:hypothetical protein
MFDGLEKAAGTKALRSTGDEYTGGETVC